jgi:hypothetical protein
MEYKTECVGGVPLRVHALEVTIRQSGDWRLVECTKHSRDGWISLKLYLDRAANKNVWRLGVKKEYLARSHDGHLLDTFYPSMRDWVVAQANGRDVPLPENDQELVGVRIPLPDKVRAFVVESILERQSSERPPLSNKAQTRKFGRYIVDIIASECNVSVPKAKYHVDTMIEQGIIEFAMIDKHKRISGLRVVKGASNV